MYLCGFIKKFSGKIWRASVSRKLRWCCKVTYASRSLILATVIIYCLRFYQYILQVGIKGTEHIFRKCIFFFCITVYIALWIDLPV